MGTMLSRPRGVTVSTLDSESSNRGSNPREASVPGGCPALSEVAERSVTVLNTSTPLWPHSPSGLKHFTMARQPTFLRVTGAN